jgi:23S rRNA (uridine2552-2'-O)-methyltransferase
MTGRDEYYNRSKQEGYRARSAYKLKQLDEAADLFASGDAVVDLGAAPGGWLQVAAEAVGSSGTVVGVDRQRIRPLDAENVETIRGDMTDEETVDRLRDVVGSGGVDVVVSDMAPNMTGEYSVDHARSIHLARQAFGVAVDTLAPGGDLVVKVFDGPDLADFRSDMEESFEYVRAIRPDASRDASSELYLVAKGYLTAPVAAGDELVVEVTDEGREGDGIARVDGFTVFVPDADVGEEVEVRIEDVKPRFAFAERLD